MATSRYTPTDLRRQVGSPRPKGRDNKDTLCRNVLIYGHCRYEDSGCSFSHDQNQTKSNSNQQEITKKALNVESPSFTPSNLQLSKKPTFSSQAASAPAFTPRGLGATSAPVLEKHDPPVFNPASIREFTPTFDLGQSSKANGAPPDGGMYHDPFSMNSVNQALPSTPYNPYAEEHGGLGGPATGFFPPQSAYTAPLAPLQHHLYAPRGPHRDDLLPYQRMVHDFFMPEKVREHYQKKADASLQVLPNSQLPTLENFHSLVPLDTNHRKSTSMFGFPSWAYKATSSKTGNLYCLRRLEGYRLTNEHAIRLVKEWRRVDNGNVISTMDAFTTRAFGDSSLVFVHDYHPLSKSLAEAHLNPVPTHTGRYHTKTPIAEPVLWSYVSQIANATKAIHNLNLAARCIDVSKIIITDKNRIRLGSCSILDVLQYEARRPISELQQEDFQHFGKVMLCLATNTLPMHLTNLKASVEQMSRTYSAEMRDTIMWLLTPQQPSTPKNIDEFIRGISTNLMTSFDRALHANDRVGSDLYRELENGRIARIMMKLGTVNERQEFDADRVWSENGERYMLKLFRDYVFHQVDSNGNPVLDMGHMIRSLNKLDAGTEERICLTSRDEQTSFLVTYKELKKQLGIAFGELVKARDKQGRNF